MPVSTSQPSVLLLTPNGLRPDSLLLPEGTRLSQVGHLEDALRLAREWTFDLAFVASSDANAARQMLSQLATDPATRALPIVVLVSGEPGETTISELLEAGSAEVVSPEAPPQALQARLRALVRARRMFLEVREQSLRDELTGLYNRRFCFERLEQEVARADRYGTGLACLIVDIDHFKQINDTRGHAVGDEALRAVAGVLRRWTRRSDIVARVGGDEFAVLLVGNTEAGARVYADGLRKRVSAIRLETPAAPPMTLSIGIAYYPGPAVRNPLDELVPAADAALLRAKRLGRDRVEVAGSVPGAESVDALCGPAPGDSIPAS